MSLSSTTNRVAYLGDGSSASFSFPYYFFTQADLNVYLYRTITGAVETQVLNTNYTISGTTNDQGLYPSGANVVMGSAILSSVYIVITRDPDLKQNFILQQNAVIPSAALTQQLDYLTLLLQRQQDENSRSVILPDGFGATFDPTLPSNITLAPNAALITNSSATGWVLDQGESGAFGIAGFVLTGNGSSQIATYQAISLSASGAVTGTLSLGNGGTGGLSPQTWGVVYASSATQLATTDPGPVGWVLTSNASSAPTYQQVSLSTSEITGILPIANGGTSNSNFTQFGVIISNSGRLSATAAGTPGFMLTANSAAVPTYQGLSGSSYSGIWPITQGGTGVGSGLLQFSLVVMSSTTQMGMISGLVTPGSVLTANSGAMPSFQAASIGNSGILSVVNGGTGIGSGLLQYSLVVMSSTTQMGMISGLATPGNVLTVNSGAMPSFQAAVVGNSGVLSVLNGGTGTGNNFTQYGILYASSTTQAGIVPSSTSGFILTAAGSSAPTFLAPVTNSYVQVYNPSGATWDRSNAAFGDPALASGSNTIVVRTSNGMTVAQTTASFAAITFTPPVNTAVYSVSMTTKMLSNTAGTLMSLGVVDGAGTVVSTALATEGAVVTIQGDSVTVHGIYAPASTSPVTLKVQTAGTSGNLVEIGSAAGAAATAAIEWTLFRIM